MSEETGSGGVDEIKERAESVNKNIDKVQGQMRVLELELVTLIATHAELVAILLSDDFKAPPSNGEGNGDS